MEIFIQFLVPYPLFSIRYSLISHLRISLFAIHYLLYVISHMLYAFRFPLSVFPCLLCTICYLLFSCFFPLFSFAAELRVYYVAVGQGDAIYMELPNGENVLIDGGPNSSNSTNNPLIYFLESKNIKKINHVILSHPHADHYAGLGPAFDRYEIKRYYDSFLLGSSAAQSFRSKATSEPGVTVVNTMDYSSGYTFTWSTTTPKVEAVMLHRGDAFGQTPPSANDVSLVFRVVFGSSTFIFGGDAGGSGGSYKNLEGWMAGTYGGGVESDCYKVHHHGSASSSSDSNFMSKLNPRYAFIGTDGIKYGHPTIISMDNINVYTSKAEEKIVQEIKGKIYTNIYPTYLNGNIMVGTSGDGKYKIQTNYAPTPIDTTPTGDIVDIPPAERKTLGYVNAVNNKFNPETESMTIEYLLNKSGESVFRVYTLAGEVVYEDKVQNVPAGSPLRWNWNGRNSNGEMVASGAYFVFVKTPEGKEVRKAVVMR